MKRITVFSLLLLMIITGCSAPGINGNSPGSSRVTINDQYRIRGVFDNLNKTILIDSFADFQSFLTKYEPGEEKSDSLLALYNEEFFKHNVLYAQALEIGSGSTTVTADKAKIENGILNLSIKTKTPNIATMDMAYWVCLFGLDKGLVKDIQDVEVNVDKRILSDSDTSSVSDPRNFQYQSNTEGNHEFDNNKPIVLKTYDEYKEFISTFPPSKEVDLSEKYDEDYFETHVVYAQNLMVYSGSIKVEARDYQVLDGTLKLIVDYYVPETYTDDIAYWVCMFGVEKSLAETATVEVVIEENRR